MPTQGQQQQLNDLYAAVMATLTDDLAPTIAERPGLADVLIQRLDEQFSGADRNGSGPPDHGLSALIGLGDDAAPALDAVHVPRPVKRYDDTVASERVRAVGDLYYLYQHERIGVFRAISTLQDLFRAGTVRLSAGPGAYALYRFDRREVLRYTERDRMSAYRRAFGYGKAPLPRGAQPNADFHRLFAGFNRAVAGFWRDKRISDVIRAGANDPSFGSIATVRRSGLDLRNNLKFTSYGNVSVLRVEVMQLLDEAFRILEAPDVRQLFGADNAWDALEEVLTRHRGERPNSSPRHRMAVAGRNVLQWLSNGYVLEESRLQFETLLRKVADPCEEWLTSAEAVGAVRSS